MVCLSFEPLKCWLHHAMSSFCSLLTEDSKPNLLLFEEWFNMANQDVHFPGRFDDLSSDLLGMQDQMGRLQADSQDPRGRGFNFLSTCFFSFTTSFPFTIFSSHLSPSSFSSSHLSSPPHSSSHLSSSPPSSSPLSSSPPSSSPLSYSPLSSSHHSS